MAGKHVSNRVGPSSGETIARMQRAMAAHQAGDLSEAETLYKLVLTVDEEHFVALLMLGILNGQLGNYEEAERVLRSAARIQPNDAGCHFNHGNALAALQRYDDALGAFDHALTLNPRFAEARLNRGAILLKCRRFEEAVANYDAALRVNPNLADAHCNRGIALEELMRHEEALASYDAALAISASNAEYYANRSNVLHKLRRFDEALASIEKALSLAPDNAAFYYNRGNVLFALKHYRGAFADYHKAFRINPDLEYVEGNRFYTKMLMCDWSNFDTESSRLVARVAAGKMVMRPFAFLCVNSSPFYQMKCAEVFAKNEFPKVRPLWNGKRYRHDRIRIAYLSADFRDHPVAYLLAGVFESHDLKQFETTALSFGADDRSSMRARLENAFERFIDVREQSDAAVAKLLSDNEVDIAVDLMGPTKNARPAILSNRPAPIQVNYLGYAGSSGSDYIDYVLADRIVIPEDERIFFSENVIYLPDTFMGADESRKIADQIPMRADEGLPERGFVFCSFNNSYKITPPMFDVWMKLLRAVEGSVLWLSGSNDDAVRQLRREAEARNVQGDRLIFTRRVERNEDHLARYRLADLFLDTLPFGAHSTASDSLWAGTPILTCAGSTFSGRVSASLLTALGLSELITDGLPAYEDLAMTLALDSQRLASVRAKLIANRAVFPLFDTKRFTRHLEIAYRAMWERYQRGQPPSTISVAPMAV
jgi:protein O-GlcNAc transferase